MWTNKEVDELNLKVNLLEQEEFWWGIKFNVKCRPFIMTNAVNKIFSSISCNYFAFAKYERVRIVLFIDAQKIFEMKKKWNNGFKM